MGLLRLQTLREEIPQVRLHPNAKLTPVARRLLVDRVEKLGWPVARVARAAGVSRQTAYKWLNRFRESGESGFRCPLHVLPELELLEHLNSQQDVSRILRVEHRAQ